MRLVKSTKGFLMRRIGIVAAVGALATAGTVARHVQGRGTGGATSDDTGKLLKGAAAYGDWRDDAPGVRRLITAADMPRPFATKSADNGAHMVLRPTNAWPQVLPGFRVDQIATGLREP